jgi:hypothetical protein
MDWFHHKSKPKFGAKCIGMPPFTKIMHQILVMCNASSPKFDDWSQFEQIKSINTQGGMSFTNFSKGFSSSNFQIEDGKIGEFNLQ